MLTAFLKAGFARASSSVVLNGVSTQGIPLTRSVRQGCPLSPLLFILAIDVLSPIFQQAMDDHRIVGVPFPEVGIQAILSMFADYIAIVARAQLRYIREI